MFAGPRVVRRRPLLRAAVVGGTTYAAGRAAGRRAAEAGSAEAYPDQYQRPEQQPPAPAAPQQDAGPSESSMLDQISRLAMLHQQGALTDEEFAAAKAKLLS
jgi:hypothetical protein